MNKEQERKIHKKPTGFKLEKDEVWGEHDDDFKLVSKGKIVARGYPDVDGKYFTQAEYERLLKENYPDVCPVWKDKLPYKSVTAICNADEVDEVSYWLSYVHGGEYSKTKTLEDGRVAIRSDYHAW